MGVLLGLEDPGSYGTVLTVETWLADLMDGLVTEPEHFVGRSGHLNLTLLRYLPFLVHYLLEVSEEAAGQAVGVLGLFLSEGEPSRRVSDGRRRRKL